MLCETRDKNVNIEIVSLPVKLFVPEEAKAEDEAAQQSVTQFDEFDEFWSGDDKKSGGGDGKSGNWPQDETFMVSGEEFETSSRTSRPRYKEQKDSSSRYQAYSDFSRSQESMNWGGSYPSQDWGFSWKDPRRSRSRSAERRNYDRHYTPPSHSYGQRSPPRYKGSMHYSKSSWRPSSSERERERRRSPTSERRRSNEERVRRSSKNSSRRSSKQCSRSRSPRRSPSIRQHSRSQSPKSGVSVTDTLQGGAVEDETEDSAGSGINAGEKTFSSFFILLFF